MKKIGTEQTAMNDHGDTNQDDVVKAYKKAARIYCEKTGQDPDMMVPSPVQSILGANKLVPVWHFVAHELHDLSLKLVSIKEAATDKKETRQ